MTTEDDFMYGKRIPVRHKQPTFHDGRCNYILCQRPEKWVHTDDCVIYGMVIFAEVARDRSES